MPKRVVKLLFSVGLLLVAFWAGKYAVADFYYLRAKTVFESLDIEKLNYSDELDAIINHCVTHYSAHLDYPTPAHN